MNLNAGCVRSASRKDANWLMIKTIGDTGDASSEEWHADFVTKTTSGRACGGAVLGPDAIIPFKPVRPTDLILAWPAFFLEVFKTL